MMIEAEDERSTLGPVWPRGRSGLALCTSPKSSWPMIALRTSSMKLSSMMVVVSARCRALAMASCRVKEPCKLNISCSIYKDEEDIEAIGVKDMVGVLAGEQ